MIAGVGDELTDSLVAVMLAVPAPTAVTVAGEPLALTERTAVLLETQVIVRPVRKVAARIAGCARVSCWVLPRIIGVVGAETETLATAAGSTVSRASPGLSLTRCDDGCSANSGRSHHSG